MDNPLPREDEPSLLQDSRAASMDSGLDGNQLELCLNMVSNSRSMCSRLISPAALP